MTDTRLVNLTPHPVDIVIDGAVLTLQPLSPAARIDIHKEQVAMFPLREGSVPVFRVSNGLTIDLPGAQPGVTYVVSRMVADANPDRADLVFPLDLIRDENGHIIGCGSFGTVHNS